MGRRLLVPGAGWEQAALVRRALDEGWEVVAAGPAGSPVADLDVHFEVGAPTDLDALLDLATRHDVTAVASDQDDFARWSQAWLVERLGLPGPRLAAVAPTVNKGWLRGLCAGAVRQPAWGLARSVDEARSALADVGLPAIVKPVDARGSFGVLRVDVEADLPGAVLDALRHSPSRQVIVEQFIEGEVLTVDGAHLPDGHVVLGIASKWQVAGQRQVAMQICYPARVPAEAHRKAAEAADAVAAVLRARGASGLTHTELLWDGEDVWLIESANRGGGVSTSSTILPAHAGFDTNGFLLAEAEGVPFVHTPGRTSAVVLEFLRLPTGRIVGIHGMDTVKAHAAVIEAGLWVAEGDLIVEVADATNRNGYVIVAGEDIDAALAASREVIGQLVVDIEDKGRTAVEGIG